MCGTSTTKGVGSTVTTSSGIASPGSGSSPARASHNTGHEIVAHVIERGHEEIDRPVRQRFDERRSGLDQTV
tara:strand:+ start:484 stop:699 length:216 start_codon:yes stop_codon:yes gene_type:complete